MGFFNLNQVEILAFFLSFVRIGSLLLLLPIYGDITIPANIRVLLAFAISLCLFPMVREMQSPEIRLAIGSDMKIVGLVLMEAVFGIILGTIAKIFIDGLNMSFSLMGLHMGFSMASVYDHHTESNNPVIGQLIFSIAMLLFLSINGHHVFLKALVDSFNLVHLGAVHWKFTVINHILDAITKVFWIAMRLSSPMALTIFLLNCAFGIVAKAVPQINVLVVSFTVNISIGFLVILLCLPVLGISIHDVYNQMFSRFYEVMILFS